MVYHTRTRELLEASGVAETTQSFVTMGTVVDTNDPQQMGRVRAICPAWGDTFSTPFENVPWCMYASPFGGQLSNGTRGPGLQKSEGGITYGMWAIPKIGAQVLVMCLDGDPQYRVYIGCVFDQLTPHTMPHGRWMYDDHVELAKDGMTGKPAGPYTSREKFIEPLNQNIKQAFGNKDEPNFEWRTRAADYTVSAVSVDQLDHTVSKVQDDRGAVHDGWTSTQGYGINRADPTGETSLTDKNYDSTIYSISTPGAHALSMDDRQENCRIRLRTTAGHQIIMDDTNERIYIQTAKGNNWIELDQAGNIDMYTTNKVNIRAAKDINLTSDETIRMSAKKGIHLYSEDEIRAHAVKDISVLTEENLRIHSLQGTLIQSDQTMHITSGENLYITTAQDVHNRCGSNMMLSAGGSFHNNAGGSIIETASMIHMNGPSAAVAEAAQPPNERKAFWTNRVPDHEPYARCMTKHDYTHEPEFSYDSKDVNRVERGNTIARGMFWRR